MKKRKIIAKLMVLSMIISNVSGINVQATDNIDVQNDNSIEYNVDTENSETFEELNVDKNIISNETVENDDLILDGVNIQNEITMPEISEIVSNYASIPEVRSKLVTLQRKMSEKYNVIMDGRDIGTVVLKNSKFKFFLTASPEERARRRYTELLNRGLDVNYDKLLEDIIKRDHIDSTRAVDPLKKADDAIEIDSSNYNIAEVTEIICNFIENALQ